MFTAAGNGLGTLTLGTLKMLVDELTSADLMPHSVPADTMEEVETQIQDFIKVSQEKEYQALMWVRSCVMVVVECMRCHKLCVVVD